MRYNQDYSSYKAADFLMDENFVRWISTGDPELNVFWTKWMTEHPDQTHEVTTARKILEALDFQQATISKESIEKEWKKLQVVFDSKDRQPVTITPEGKKSIRTSFWLAAAAIVFLVMTGGLYYLTQSSFRPEKMIVRTAEAGQRLTIILKDGTKTLLNSGSTITYPETFRSDQRHVRLTGEAFFEVAPDPNAPFLITSGDITTEVVGTSFGIAAYPGKGDVRVAVVSGKVKVYTNEQVKNNAKLSLTPSQMATFKTEGQVFFVDSFDKSKQLAWIDGVLYFEKDNFNNVMSKLEKWYGVTVITDPALTTGDGLLLTGKFKNKSLSYVLDSYKYPDRFNYEIKKDTLIIYQ